MTAPSSEATPRPWVFTAFVKKDGSQMTTAQDVADALTLSALTTGGSHLMGVTNDDDLVICHTGNGVCSEANAALIVRAVNSYDESRKLLREAVEMCKTASRTMFDHGFNAAGRHFLEWTNAVNAHLEGDKEKP